MNKKMRELLAKIAMKREMAKSYMEDDTNKDLEKAKALMDEADKLQEEYELEKRMYEAEKADNVSDNKEDTEKSTLKKVTDKVDDDDDDGESEKSMTKSDKVVHDFAKAIRNTIKDMVEGVPANGGLLVPQDIQTRIEQRREAKFGLQQLVTTETVKTSSGRRVYQKRIQQTGFEKVGEKSKIGKKTGPQFEPVEYKIEKYGGWLAIANELLEDSDENLVNFVIDWLADESRITRNKLILAKIATKATKTIAAGINGIKGVLNVDLGQAFKPTSSIVTNDDGLNYLDTLEDKNGRPLLNPDPTVKSEQVLRCGASIVPIVVIPNKDYASPKDGVPFIIGDLKAGIRFFDRKQVTIRTSDVATAGTGDDSVNAFEEDCTLVRAIEREDVQITDNDAFVPCVISTKVSA